MSFLANIAAAAAAAAVCVQAAPPISANEVLIFNDDFNTFNLSLWKHELTLSGGGNWEFELYTNNRTNSFVRNGSLNIMPSLLADTIGQANVQNGFTMDISGGDPASVCTSNAFYGCIRTSGAGGNYLNPIQSVRLRTAETFAFQYGRVEISAKLPKGDWMWPALWMLPVNQAYGNWPVSGEIDIMESRGNARGYPAGGVEQFGSTLHWGPYGGVDPYLLTHATYTLPTGELSDDFHIYGLYWNETVIQTYLDTPSNVVLNVNINQSFWQLGGFANSTIANPWEGQGNNAPFDQRFYFVINVAVGGTNGYFPDGVGGKPWADTDPHAINAFTDSSDIWYPTWPHRDGSGAGSPFQIDSIKVWQQQDSQNYAYKLML